MPSTQRVHKLSGPARRSVRPAQSNAKPSPPRNVAWLQIPAYNKGTAFTEAERDALGLRGLLPPHVFTQDEQVERVMMNYRKESSDLGRYVYLVALQDRNETLFYRVVRDHLEEMMPIIYTPTVGRACQEYGNIFRRPRGLYISARDRGRVAKILRNWPYPDVRVVVVTDGERILGLGDLGAHGMGIPVGKLALYTVCGGIAPRACLPVQIDVGTNNEDLLRHPLYTGLKQPRLRGESYDALLEEFVRGVERTFPGALIQFEDFANLNAFRLLRRYRGQVAAFDDDIQGTAAVALAGLSSALRLTGETLKDQTILLLGAGQAGVGIADLVVEAMVAEGMKPEAARRRCWFVDSKGLVVKSRGSLAEHKLAYAHDMGFQPDLLSSIRALKPTTLVGVSGASRSFTRPVIEAMSRLRDRPVIFALSNPTSKAECTAEEAYTWSGGRAIFASGSPFPPVTLEGKTYVPGQGNNAYIFPGVGLGILTSAARQVTDSMFLQAARTLAGAVEQDDLAQGRVYPSWNRIRDVSVDIAAAVSREVYRLKLGYGRRPQDLRKAVRSRMWEPNYPTYDPA